MVKDVIRCSVPNCSSSSALSLVDFYRFPGDENDRKYWLTIIGCPELFELPVENLLSNHFVCSLHFEIKYPETDNLTENLLNGSEKSGSDGTFQDVFQPTSSPDQDVHVDEKNIPSYCTCGRFFLNQEEFDLHILNGCPLLSHESNANESSYTGNLNYDDAMRENKMPREEATTYNAIPKCNECGKTFSNAMRLRHHMSQHTGHRPYKCKICGNTFVEKSCLKTHMTIIHTDKEFLCDICNRPFKSPYYLKTHRFRHENIKNYKCSICPQVAFVDKQSLKLHMRTHTKEKPYRCTICSKQFSQCSHLNTHMKIHNNEKPFECSICHKVFRQVANLIEHKKTHV